MIEEAEVLQCNVIGFNFRNVSQSAKIAPSSKTDLIIDGIAQVQRLIDTCSIKK